ncbi:GATA transcription factor 2-like [Macadamia integrifolia]|uniref:GATA transcription factor 2-like n=1 Tax=Macadamia integrifolia TaxID=60698 RepID=UPI001C4F1CE7|nr:GATA transcription factor 2-like [Macadamia integrifolia]
MDFSRNVPVSGGLQSELPPEQLMSPAPSSLGGFSGSLDDLFPAENTEGDVGLEWLSIFVEDCLSSSGNCIPAPKSTQNNQKPKASKPLQRNHHNPSLHQDFVIPPGKARSKRKRATAAPLSNWSHMGVYPQNQILHLSSSDPPLLRQAYWLADSELILPNKVNNSSNSNTCISRKTRDGEERRQEKVEVVVSKESSEGGGNVVVQPRRCTHCLSQRTPQWRAGPLGPKTLCNACGVRFKSGRLLPEYRPAKSPTFVSYKHSNSHKKVIEMRMSLPSSVHTE